jgi:hypothetical protein
MQRVNRFARFWDMIGNSGRFRETLPIILGDSAFERFLRLSDALYAIAGSSWKISLKRLFELLYRVLIEQMAVPAEIAQQSLNLDFQRSGLKGRLNHSEPNLEVVSRDGVANKRQRQHLQG